MSVVTNIIVAFSCGEAPDSDWDETVINEINKYFDGETSAGKHQRFVIVRNTDWYGGSKRLETGLIVGAFNYLNLEEFIEHLRKIRWYHPEEVQIIVKEQYDDQFRIINVMSKDA